MSDYQAITYEEDGHVAWITLNRPEAMNAFNQQMLDEIYDVWRRLRADHNIHCAVLTGAGEQAFCSGVDRHELVNPEAVRATLDATSNRFMYDDPGRELGPKSADLWKPVVCAVNGLAAGGAFYMLGEVDIIIAAEHATFTDPHVTYGMAAVFESMHLLQKLPLGEVLRVALTGLHEKLTAARAKELGLVSEVVPMGELHDTAKRLADAIAAQEPLAVQTTQRAIWLANEIGRQAALDMAPGIVGMGSVEHNVNVGQRDFLARNRPKPRLRD